MPIHCTDEGVPRYKASSGLTGRYMYITEEGKESLNAVCRPKTGIKG